MLTKIWIFELNFSLLVSFLIGVAFGIMIISLVYLIFVLSSVKKRNYIVKSKVNDVSDEEIKQIIKSTQDAFKDKTLKQNNTNIAYCKDLCFDLVKNIARKFFPNSKYPLLELSVNESLLLTIYISNRVDELFDYPGLRVLKKIKISTIISMSDVKKTIEANKLVKATKKYKILEALTAAKNVINIVNPVYWVRKLVIDSAIDLVVKKLCIIVIGITGEETYKIYSKTFLNQEVEIDTGINQLINETISNMQNDNT